MAFLIGFFSHFFIDAIPHVDPGTFFNIPENKDKSWPLWIYIFASLEFIFIWSIVILLFKDKPDFGIIMIGGLGAITVDILDNNPFRFLRRWPIIKQIHWLHRKMHYELPPTRWYWGFVPQAIIIGVSLWVLFLKF